MQVQEARNEFLEEVVTRFLQMRVCGIVVVGFEDATLREDLRQLLLECGVPVVFVERTARSYGLNRVLLDGGAGIYLATRHLIELGHRNLLYIAMAPFNDVDRQRMRGYQAAMTENSVADPPIVNTMQGGSIREGYESAKIGLKQWPETTAIVAWSDQFAIGAMQYCFDTGRRVPEDIAVTGFDDIYAAATVPPLTSVKMPMEEMAQAAISIIVEQREHPADTYAKTITLSPKLTIRLSTG